MAASRAVDRTLAAASQQTQEGASMTASQPTRRRAAAVWRTARDPAAALLAIHEKQILMWELEIPGSPDCRWEG